MKRKICSVLVLVLLCAQLLTITSFASYLPGDTVVYITEYGTRYHNDWCGALWNSRYKITLADAVAEGYTRCDRCWPGLLDPDWQPPEPEPAASPSPEPSLEPSPGQTPSPSPSPNPSPSSSPSKSNPSPPLPTYSSISPVQSPDQPSSHVSSTHEEAPGDMMLLLSGTSFAAAAAACIAYLVWSRKRYRDRQDARRTEILSLEKTQQEMEQKQIEKEARLQEEARQAAFEEKRAEYAKTYGGKPPESFCDMPIGVEIGLDDLPKECGSPGMGNWGDSFTYYRTKSGKCVHKKCGCCGATIPVHAWMVLGGTPLCSKCCAKSLPDMAWYEKYIQIKAIKMKFNIV